MRTHREDLPDRFLDINFAAELEHGVDVSNLAYEVARELGLPEETCYQLAIAGMVHDIGKFKLIRYIEGAEDLMAIEDLRYVRMHSTLGYLVLKEQGYSELILESVLYHHENYDGSGCPSNLIGDEIPLGARILRVCDVYAALRSDRAYRKALDEDSIMKLMIEEVKNFDMRIFLAFQRVIHNEKEGGSYGVKEETDYRHERYLAQGNGDPELCDEYDSGDL